MSRLREQLERLKELSEQLNKKTDEISAAVRSVEEFLSFHLGATAPIHHETIGYMKGKIVVWNEKEWILYSQASRISKISSFKFIPQLLEEIEKFARDTINEAIEADKVLKKMMD